MTDWFAQQSQRAVGQVQAIGSRITSAWLIGAFVRAALKFSSDGCSVFAAALAYYALLSIFPLMLFLVVLASPFLSTDAAVRSITASIAAYLPAGAPLIRAALQEVTQQRGPVTIVAAAGFLWSASAVFDTLQTSLNRVFSIKHARPLWREWLVSMGMVIGTGVLLGLSFVGTVAIRLGISRHFGRNDLVLEIVTILIAVLIAFWVFAILYRYLPYRARKRWRDVWSGALVGAILWEIAKLGFAWYLVDFSSLNLVYGSLGAVIAFMLWGYITMIILLFGAEIAATHTDFRSTVIPHDDRSSSRLEI